MSLEDQIIAALATAAAAIVTALGSWAAAWARRKVSENEAANRAIAAQSLWNGGSMVRLDKKMDGLHDTINGGQLPAIVKMAITNSDAVQTILELAESHTAAIAELKELVASMCRFDAAGASHAPGGRHCPDHVDDASSQATAKSVA